MSLIKKMIATFLIITSFSTVPALASCEDNKQLELEFANELNSIDSFIKEDSNKDIKCYAYSYQVYNNQPIFHIYGSEYFPPIYSYIYSNNTVTPVLQQPESYKHYTITYCPDKNIQDIPLKKEVVIPIKEVSLEDLKFLKDIVSNYDPNFIIEDGAVEGEIIYKK